jgi:hypothetical protein
MAIKATLLSILAVSVTVTVSTAAYLTNAEIKLKARELLNTPHQILELYAEHKQGKGSGGPPSALEYLLSSLHVDSLTQPTNHSMRHVLQIQTDDQVNFAPRASHLSPGLGRHRLQRPHLRHPHHRLLRPQRNHTHQLLHPREPSLPSVCLSLILLTVPLSLCQCTCTPSRASLITGKYAIKTGLQVSSPLS